MLTAAEEELLDTTSISVELSLLGALGRSSFFSLTFSFFFAAGDLPFLAEKQRTIKMKQK